MALFLYSEGPKENFRIFEGNLVKFINDHQKIQTAQMLSKCNGGYQMTKTVEGKSESVYFFKPYLPKSLRIIFALLFQIFCPFSYMLHRQGHTFYIISKMSSLLKQAVYLLLPHIPKSTK